MIHNLPFLDLQVHQALPGEMAGLFRRGDHWRMLVISHQMNHKCYQIAMPGFWMQVPTMFDKCS